MTEAIFIPRLGGPEVLTAEKIEVGDPGAGEARLRQSAVGLNFIDCYHRSGLYPGPDPPFIPGVEGVGVVEAVGDGVSEVAAGERVAYVGPLGAYAGARHVPAERLIPLPRDLDDETVAAILLKGLTTWYLVHESFRVHPGDHVLVHAAAGGVGLLLCQWAKHLGATVIGTVGSEEKAQLARRHGCDHPLLYQSEPWAERARELTGGRGVEVAYDSVGQATFAGSLDCLARRGMLVTYGNASGPPPAIEPLELMRRGSLSLTRPTLWDFVPERDQLLAAAAELFGVVGSGAVRPVLGQRWPLAEAAQAHRALEERRTSGASILIPE